MHKNIVKMGILCCLTLFGCLQFWRPDLNNPVTDAALELSSQAQMADEVSAIFERACRDCHSNQTDWPWYSRVAPVSWLIASDVRLGRQRLNFSEWGRYNERQIENKLAEICAAVQAGAMPLKNYTLIHRDAKLTTAEVQAICSWTKQASARLHATNADEALRY